MKGCGDVEIRLDGDLIKHMDEEQILALMDHEVTHIQVRENKDGEILFDDLGRPKIDLRKHDHEFGWFDEVAQRWGESSMEVKQAKQLVNQIRESYALDQALLDFGKQKEKAA